MSKRFSILLVILTIVSGLIGGAITGRVFTPKVAIAEETTQSRILTVEELRVVDKDGKELMYLGKAKKAPFDRYGLFILDNRGSAKATISAGEKYGGAVLIQGKDDESGVSMIVGENGGAVLVQGKDGESEALMMVSENGGGVSVSDKDGKVGALMRIDENGGAVYV